MNIISKETKLRGKRIRSIRKLKDIKRVKMAEDLVISESYLCKIERGYRPGTLEFYMLVADYFGVTIDYLLNGKETTEEEKREIKRLVKLIDMIEKKVG